MKSELERPLDLKIEYPCIMKNADTDLVILFTDIHVGTVIQPDDSGFTHYGEHATDWSIDNMSYYDGKVILSN